jgi:hypothetical protein
MRHFHHRPQFQPKANIPMGGETRDRLALEIRMACEHLIGHASIESYNTLSKMFAALLRAGMVDDLVKPGSRIMGAICDRYEEAGSITVEPEEAAGLRQAVADIDAGLHRIPVQRFARAVAEVETFVTVVDIGPSTGSGA